MKVWIMKWRRRNKIKIMCICVRKVIIMCNDENEIMKYIIWKIIEILMNRNKILMK